MELMQVKQGVALVWPRSWNRRDRLRGEHGYIVDMDSALERKEFCKGQERKFVAYDGDKGPDHITDPMALDMIREETGEVRPRRPKRTINETIKTNDGHARAEKTDEKSAVAVDELLKGKRRRKEATE